MPTISIFSGIKIRMYFLGSEHNPPHIHAIYAGESAAIVISTGVVLEGELPEKVLGLVRKWIEMYEEELMKMWHTQKFEKLPPLV